jgi:Cu/Ag efflux pump CusA
MNQPGQEIEGPMAITVLGGLLTSTLLNLLVLPALAKRFSYRESRRKLRAAARERYASEGNLAE